MARQPRVPTELTRQPFTLEEAFEAGLTKSQLKGSSWHRIGSKLYCRRGMPGDHWKLLSAWQRRLPAEAVFVGTTAAWMLGLDFRPDDPVEIAVRVGSGIRLQRGLRVHRGEISTDEVVVVRGLRATSILRTLSDLCVRWPAEEALVALDMAVASGLTDTSALSRHADVTRGRPGARVLRALAGLAAPAESPMETRLRWVLIQGGLPQPRVQTDLSDCDGRFVGRADLFYPDTRLVLEYDGDIHRSRLGDDNRRQNLLINAGFRLLRFTAADVYQRPDVLVAQVRAALVPRISASFSGAGRAGPASSGS